MTFRFFKVKVNFFRHPFFSPNHLDQSVIEFINNTFRMLIGLIDDKTCSAIGRDCSLDLVVKFVDRANGCNWVNKFVVSGKNCNFFRSIVLLFSWFRCTKSFTCCINCSKFNRQWYKTISNHGTNQDACILCTQRCLSWFMFWSRTWRIQHGVYGIHQVICLG